MQQQGGHRSVQHVAASRRAQPAVEDHAQRRRERLAFGQAHGEPRVIGQHGAAAAEDRRAARAPALHVGTRRLAGDPLRLAAGQRGAAVQAHRQLHPHPRAAALDPAEEADVEFARRLAHQAGVDGDAGSAQKARAAAVDLRERILGGDHHPLHACGNQRIGARRRAAVVRAGLQRHIGGGATRPLAGFAQRVYLGMRLTGTLVETRADHPVAMRDHATHARIRLGGAQAAFGQAQGVRHVSVINSRKKVGHDAAPFQERTLCANDVTATRAFRAQGAPLRWGHLPSRLPPPSRGNCKSASPGRSRSSFSISSRNACTSSNLR